MHPAGGGRGGEAGPHPCPAPEGEGGRSRPGERGRQRLGARNRGRSAVTTPLLQVDNLAREYALPRETLLGTPAKVRALDGVSFTIEAGRSLGIVGESGSGKSTLARLVMALDQPTSGSVRLLGRDLHALPREALRQARRDIQMVFQDP